MGTGGVQAGRTWAHSIDQSNHLLLYGTSLHLALTQYMPAPMDIAPVTEAERFFAIFVVLSALLVFSSIVGSISAKITELRQLKLDEVVAQSQLRQYLTDKGISLQLGQRIWHFVRGKRWEYR